MVSRLDPYISFGDSARAAVEFYRDVFGGTLAIRTFGEFGDKDAPVLLEKQMWGDEFGMCVDRRRHCCGSVAVRDR
ncbi:hypothetical protein [Nocardia australiensis]|uniref:hypothetical protein n=1 Tax=Nocardia australiensis TaxID=2887191 RepID=UPI001D132C76|nr:hypothetical protein [Nocardia australiensis]